MPKGCEVKSCAALYGNSVSPVDLEAGMQSTTGVRPDPGLGDAEFPLVIKYGDSIAGSSLA